MSPAIIDWQFDMTGDPYAAQREQREQAQAAFSDGISTIFAMMDEKQKANKEQSNQERVNELQQSLFDLPGGEPTGPDALLGSDSATESSGSQALLDELQKRLGPKEFQKVLGIREQQKDYARVDRARGTFATWIEEHAMAGVSEGGRLALGAINDTIQSPDIRLTRKEFLGQVKMAQDIVIREAKASSKTRQTERGSKLFEDSIAEIDPGDGRFAVANDIQAMWEKGLITLPNAWKMLKDVKAGNPFEIPDDEQGRPAGSFAYIENMANAVRENDIFALYRNNPGIWLAQKLGAMGVEQAMRRGMMGGGPFGSFTREPADPVDRQAKGRSESIRKRLPKNGIKWSALDPGQAEEFYEELERVLSSRDTRTNVLDDFIELIKKYNLSGEGLPDDVMQRLEQVKLQPSQISKEDFSQFEFF